MSVCKEKRFGVAEQGCRDLLQKAPRHLSTRAQESWHLERGCIKKGVTHLESTKVRGMKPVL